MKKKRLFTILLTLLSVAVLVLSPTVFYKKITAEYNFLGKQYTGIIRVWHIDTFDGGKGSRAEFLRQRALEYEKKNSGQLILVTMHTVESATAAIKGGDAPDAISYGRGLEAAVSVVQPFSSLSFKGAEVSGKVYGYPWCYGGYGVFSLKEQTGEKQLTGKTVVSTGGAAAAAALSGYTADSLDVKEPVAAYVDFLNGRYDFLIGSQRDICRFQTRNVCVFMTPLSEFSDLYQYISLTAIDEVKSAIAVKFIDYLLSQSAQVKVESISMLSAEFNLYSSDNALMTELERAKIKSTLSPFTAAVYLDSFYSSGFLALEGNSGELKKLKNSLVYI